MHGIRAWWTATDFLQFAKLTAEPPLLPMAAALAAVPPGLTAMDWYVYNLITPEFALGATAEAEAQEALQQRLQAAALHFDQAVAEAALTESQRDVLKQCLTFRDRHTAYIAQRMLTCEDEIRKLKEVNNTGSDKDNVKDRRAPEVFDGEKFSMYEWKLTNFLDDQFNGDGLA